MKNIASSLLLIALILLNPWTSWGAVTVDNSTSTYSDHVVSSLTWAHTTNGADRFLFVGVGSYNDNVTSITYNGTNLSKEWGISFNNSVRTEGWVLVAPDTGAHDVVVTFAGNTTDWTLTSAGATSFTGVDQSTPTGTAITGSGYTANPSVTATTASGEMVVDHLSGGSTAKTVGADQTEILNYFGDGMNSSISVQNGVYGGVMSWTAAEHTWAMGAVSIKPASSDDTTPNAYSLGSNLTGVSISTLTYSDNATIAGIDAATNVTVSGTGCQWSKNGAACSASADTVVVGDDVALCGTSSGSYSSVYPSCTLTVGGVTNTGAPWTVTTLDSGNMIPAERLITWQGNVGVDGGIPSRATERNCVASDGAVGDNTADDTTAIRNCISNAADNTTAYLPAGTYKVTGSITLPSWKTLRGAGRDDTILSFTDTQADDIKFVSGYSGVSRVNVSSGYTKGSTEIVLADASTFSVGDIIGIDELNNTSLGVTNVGVGTCTWCGEASGGGRIRNQAVLVTNKVSNTLTVEPPLVWTFTSGQDPEAYRLTAKVQYAGLEDLTVQNAGGGQIYTRINIQMQGSVNSWIKNVHISNCGQRCIEMKIWNYRDEIRDSKISGCIDHVNSNTCYGTLMGILTSSCLVENNIYYDTSDSIILAWGASANVFGYNYMNYTQRRPAEVATWYLQDVWSHGAHTGYNLMEGNEFSGISSDQEWGSHSYNMYFRNRVTSKTEGISYTEPVSNITAVAIDRNNRYMGLVGNVLGTDGWSDVYERSGVDYSGADDLIYKLGYVSSGDTTAAGNDSYVRSTLFRHGNYDYVNDATKWCGDTGEIGCLGGDNTTTIPASLYLASKPSWMAAGTPFPTIGPDLTPMSSPIPARIAFEGLPDTIPTAFFFQDNTNVALSTVIVSSPITVTGIDAGETPSITISGFGCDYNIDGGTYTSNSGTVGLDNVVRMRGTSSASYSTVLPSCTLTIGGVTAGAPWTVTTIAASTPSAPRNLSTFPGVR